MLTNSSRALLLSASLFACPSAFGQSDWFVDAAGTAPGSGTAQDPYTSIQFALAQTATVAGDQLLVASGTYPESIDFLGKDVTVRHDGTGALPIIMGDGLSSAVSFVSGETAGAKLIQFVVTGSVPTFPNFEPGGGVLVDGASPVLDQVIVRDCSAGIGGGVAILSGGLTLDDCQILENTAREGGGGIHVAQGSLTMQGGVVGGNLVNGPFDHGGGIQALAGSQLNLTDIVVELNNVEFGRGGGIYAVGSATLDGVTIRFNERGDFFNECFDGGGIYAPDAVGTNCTIADNGHLVTFNGGGASGGAWFDSVFRGNRASINGGGLDQGFAQNCEITENRTIGDGGTPSGPGGGAARSMLVNCLITDNLSDFTGGGAADCQLENCVIRGNQTLFMGSACGGGISGGTATDCLIEGNRCKAGFGSSGGGAVSADLVRCIVRGNVAESGAGISFSNADRCTIVHNLSTGFQGTFGGGVLNTTVTNSVLWGNAPDQSSMGTILFSNVQGGAAGTGNIDADPLFFGPGSDVHLLGNSPCIDAGDPAAPLDADGSRADMGALPFEPFHRREDESFCVGGLDLEVSGEISITATPAVLSSLGAVAFAIAGNAGYEPRVFNTASAFGVQPGGLCLVGGITRVFPSAPNQLELTPAVLSQLGLVPGDRLLVQTYRLFNGTLDISRGLDLLVRP